MSQQFILQVSELTKKVKFLLESELHTVWLTGEISNFVSASSGHWYLSLKDSKAQVRCAMFKGNNQRVRVNPKNGQQVLVRARVSLYEPRGDFQLIIEQMEDAGEGLLRQQYEKLKAKLNALGYFDNAIKKPLPKTISTVGVVTSPTGAAIKDILSVLKRRNPHTSVVIYPALVQGDEAKHDIRQAIEAANARMEVDVLIVGRGGGSLEDLWAFNEEAVVDAIYQSQLPVISAVGHEIDTTLADFVADVRAATPSAAAELASNDLLESASKIEQLTRRIHARFQNVQLQKQQQWSHLAHRLTQVHPEQQLQTHQQRSDELTLRLQNVIQQKITTHKQTPTFLATRLHQCNPSSIIREKTSTLNRLENRLIERMKQKLTDEQQQFVHFIEQLHLVSPLATIARGYSVTRKADDIVKSVEQVVAGNEIAIQVNDGTIEATIDKVTRN